MTKKKFIYITITIIVSCIALGCIYWLLGQAATIIVGLIMSGSGAKLLAKHQKITLAKESQMQKAELTQDKNKEDFRKRQEIIKNDFLVQTTKDDLATKKRMNGIQTKEDLDRETDKFLDSHEDFLDKQDGEDGFVRLTLLFCLSLFLFGSITFGLFLSHAKAQNVPKRASQASKRASQASKKRTKRLMKLLNRYKNTIIKLKKKNKLALRSQATNLLLEVEKEKIRRRSCEKRKRLAIEKPPLPTWPHMLAGIGMGVFITSVGCGAFIVMGRKN